MKTSITNIDFFILKGPKEKRPHWVSNFIVPNANELLVILETNQGVEGFGLATSYTDMSPIVHIIESGISEKILEIFDKLKIFGVTIIFVSKMVISNIFSKISLYAH